MPVLKNKTKQKKVPVEIKWLNHAWAAYQIKTSPAPLASSSTLSSYALWLPCCTCLIREGTLSCAQTSWSSLQKRESVARQFYCLEQQRDTGWDDGTCLLTQTPLHPASLQFPDSTPLHEHSQQSNPVSVVEFPLSTQYHSKNTGWEVKLKQT